MAILINKTQNNFTMISNSILHDKEVSMKERGVFCTLCSLPDKWEFSVAGLSAIVSDGIDSLNSSLRKLEKLGYISRRKIRDRQGKFVSQIEVYAQKQTNHTGLSTMDEPGPSDQGELSIMDNAEEYNTNNIKHKINKDNDKSINLSKEENVSDGLTDINGYKEQIAENIKLNWLLDIAKEHNTSEVAMVNEIYDVICDMVCFQRERIKIKDTYYPWEVVKERFLKLRYEHIADVLNRVIDASLGIKNMSNYLVSTLYTASLVGTIETQANLHDDYLKYLRGNLYE